MAEVQREARVGCWYDNIANSLLGDSSQKDVKEGEEEVVRALEEKYDALKDKLLAEVSLSKFAKFKNCLLALKPDGRWSRLHLHSTTFVNGTTNRTNSDSDVGSTAPINSRLNVVVRSPTPFGLGRNGCWPSRGSQLPRALPFIFSLCCSLNDRRRAAHSFLKIGRLFSPFLFSCPSSSPHSSPSLDER